MSMNTINGTCNTLGKEKYSFEIFSRVSSKFNFTYNPSLPGIHLVFLNYQLFEEMNTDPDFSYVKKDDKIIFLISYEGWMFFLRRLDDYLKSHYTYLNFDNVYYASEQLNFDEIPNQNKPNLKHLSFISQDIWERNNDHSVILPQMFELKDKTFLCYNKRPARHRCQLVGLMNKHNLLNNSLVSLSLSDAVNAIGNDYLLTPEKKQEFLSMLPQENLKIDQGYNTGSNHQLLHHARTLISVVTETHCFEDEISFTEKIYRPLSLGHPFIVVAAHGYLKKLRSFGFKTFSPFIDESYDDILNPYERVEKIIDVMKGIDNLSFTDKKELWENLNEIAKYNMEIFYKRDFYNTTLFEFLSKQSLQE